MPGFLVHFASLFALTLWVGGGVALSFLVVPAVFERAPSRAAAADLLGHILRRFDLYALFAGTIALAAVLLELAGTQGGARALSLKLMLLLSMLALAAFNRLSLAPHLGKLRQELGPSVESDGLFGRLHGLSVLCILGQSVLGALAIALSLMTMSVKVG